MIYDDFLISNSMVVVYDSILDVVNDSLTYRFTVHLATMDEPSYNSNNQVELTHPSIATSTIIKAI